ncbi:PTS system mannose/fructose/sorbose family transporter subunit IID [Enterococcus sp.]|uniref:PTS system mannose/fructose/sorbose family transporter subunit IID n=1 Tax=Enterococcus sp. TaxID=35783 RepID=UPI00290A7A2A|nr:PTS system mannose/fructose/sorbose family transporter subunit IID [Enterococcus sp.]MDU5334045.1 PTS system mannose/fructose/sorbose family transporter subunit IID [Enterococcus sp.]
MTKNSMLTLNKEERKKVSKMFWRNQFLMFCTSYTKQQGITYGWLMAPFLQKIYGKDTDEFYEAMGRHLDFFNTAPAMNGFIGALNLSMEEENKEMMDRGEEFDTTAISALKTSLMGPLAGIGDAVYLSVLRVVATGVALGLSQEGSMLGPILFLLIMNVPNMLIRWFTTVVGYKAGGNFISEAMRSGTFAAITKGSAVLGLIMTGAMTAQFVTFKTTFETKLSGTVFNLQNVFDSIMPGLLPLGITMICFAYLRKHNKPVRALIAVFVLAFALTILGIAG